MKAIVKEYDAFISYRHSELDSFVAEQLHKRLEAFRLPKYLVEKRNAGEKTRISRVFRDKEELPLATNLSEPIQEALEKSEFLIVICTPRLPESVWCKKEIETFIKLHGRDHVLAVLAEGEPDESFPELLLREEIKEMGADGVERVSYRAVEPLAADVRGKSKKEIAKNIKKEVLRMAAPMFDCAYDDIRQRHKEQKLKTRMQISMAISAILFIFCSISIAQGIEIKEQSLVIESQYQESLKTQSEILASVASEKLQQGDRKAAIENALNALPVYFADPERPIVPEAVYALSSALRVYDNGEILQPDFYLEQKSDITCVRTLGDNYLFTIDEKGVIWIWDIANQKLVAQYQGGHNVKSCDGIFGFHNDEVFYGLEKDCVKAYGITETKVLWSQAIENPEYLFYNLEKKEVFIVANDCFYLLDSETGDVKVKNEIPQECMGKRISYVQASREGSCYYVAFCESDSLILKIEGSDLQSEIIATIDDEVERINISADDASLFLVMNTYDMESGAMSVEVRGTVVCYSLESKEHKWEYRGTGHVENVFLLDENILLVRKRNGLTEVDIDTGSEIRSMEMDCHITGVYALNSGKYQILLNDGTVAFEFDNFSFSIMEANYNIIGNQFEDFQRIGNNYFTLEHNSNRILVYDTKMSEKATESTLTKEQVEEKYGQERHEWDGVSVISEEMEQQAIIDTERNAIIFQSLNDGEEQGEYPCATSFIDCLVYSPDGRFMFIEYANSTVELVDTITFTCLNSYEDIDDIYGCENMNDEYMVLVSLTGAYVFEQASGSCIAKVSGYLAYDEEENIFYISGGDAVYTIPFYSTEQLVDIANERVE